MFKFKYLAINLTLLSIFYPQMIQASSQIGDPQSNLGALTFSGWLRANIQDKNYSNDEHKLKFDAAKLAIQYDATNSLVILNIVVINLMKSVIFLLWSMPILAIRLIQVIV